ncbi:MarR family winged helix-turn-helix transcriptional regulator [Micromonospora profundi]|uniref:MarR family winged helix-turn-helix transcriptional regulator n=1 Tax=Micromonospora TaxID=1873 RepID=UPI0033BB0392
MDVATLSAQRLVLTLHRATTLVDRVADAHLRNMHDVTLSMFAALVTIHAIGPARQSKIAQALDVSRAAVTQRLVELVARGLVEVAPDATDQRANRVAVTGKGRELLDAAWKGLAEIDDGIEDGIDLEALQSALDTLVANAARYLAGQEVTA